MDTSVVNLIQAMLAPGIMISACGLLLLGMNNKYSLVVNRIRVLDEEKRKLKFALKKNLITEDEQNRLDNILMQLKKFEYRVKIVRNAVFFYSLAVVFFILTSLFIGLWFVLESNFASYTAFISFLVGMLSVLVGVSFAAKEVWKGYQIVQIEILQ